MGGQLLSRQGFLSGMAGVPVLPRRRGARLAADRTAVVPPAATRGPRRRRRARGYPRCRVFVRAHRNAADPDTHDMRASRTACSPAARRRRWAAQAGSAGRWPRGRAGTGGRGRRYATLAEENRISARLIAPPRGRISTGSDRDCRQPAQLARRADRRADRRWTSKFDISPASVAGRYERARIDREVRRHAAPSRSWCANSSPDEMAVIEVDAPCPASGRCRHLADVSLRRATRPPRYSRPTRSGGCGRGSGSGTARHPVGRASLEKEHDLDLRATRGRCSWR